MRLDVSEILANVGMRYPYEVDEPPIVDEDIECAGPIQGRIVFANTGSVLLVRGAVQARVVMPCSRCLVYFEQPVDSAVEEGFALETRAVGARGRQARVVVEEDENPDAGRLFDGPLFDLTELLRQHLMLAMPLQPLHDETCKGLCAQCGRNLNEGGCDCREVATHPALARLADLLEDGPGR